MYVIRWTEFAEYSLDKPILYFISCNFQANVIMKSENEKKLNEFKGDFLFDFLTKLRKSIIIKSN